MSSTLDRATAPVSLPVQRRDDALAERRSRRRLVLMLGAFTALGPLTIDMYLPALPTIGAELGVSSAAAQLTLTGTLAGLAVGQLVIGPASDSFGRRRPLIFGVALHVLASLLCIVAQDVITLGLLRFVQGFGAASAAVVAMAVVRDRYDGIAAATLFSRLMLVVGVAPVLAPTVGSQLLRFTDWRGIFVTLAVLGALLLALAVFGLGETLPEHRRTRGGVGGTVASARMLFHDRAYVGLVLVAGFAMASLFAYVSGSSFVFQDDYGLDEQQFGIAFGAGSVGLIGATQANVRLLRRYQPQQILTGALVLGTLSGALLVLTAVTGAFGLAGVLLPLWGVLFASGLVFPNAPALALARHGDSAGTAAAVLGASQAGIGALAAPLVGAFGNDGPAMGAVVLAGMALALVTFLAVVRPWELGDVHADLLAAPAAH